MRLEQIDRRVLGALRLRDTTSGMDIAEPLVVTAAGVDIRRNRRGDYVIFETPEHTDLQRHTTEFFEPLSQPSPRSVEIWVHIRDPQERYLARQIRVLLPREPNAAIASQSLFQAIVVSLFPAPTAATRPTWAVVRATLRHHDTRHRLPWAMIRVSRVSGSAAPTWSQADWRGECLIAVPTIPLVNWEAVSGPVLTRSVEVLYAGFVDPAVVPLPTPPAGATLVDLNPTYWPDPDALEQLPARAVEIDSDESPPYTLAAGQDIAATLLIHAP